MPRHVVPHKSGLHRIAAIALYRALLTQCRALRLPAPQAADSQNVIRNRFREQRHVTSHRILSVSFNAGYQAIDHLDNAVAGDTVSRAYLLDLLARAPDSAKQPPVRQINKKELDAQRREELRLRREELAKIPKINLWDRPLPLEKLSGKRHVPVLFNANHIPVLRLKKPQPDSLSVYLNARIQQRQKRHDRRHQLDRAVELARCEDQWDSIVHQICQVDSRAQDGLSKKKTEPRWRDVPFGALQTVLDAIEGEREKNAMMAKKMQDVVDRETELLEKERAEAKAKRKRAKLQEKAERQVSASRLAFEDEVPKLQPQARPQSFLPKATDTLSVPFSPM